MGTFQIVAIVMMAVSGGLFLALHGKPRTDRYSFWMWALSAAIWGTVLYLGGFFAKGC